MLFSYWHYLFIMFPIPRIKVDSSINTVHDNDCRMIQFWINNLKIKEMVWSPNKLKHCYFSTHRCLQPLGFKLTLLLILLITLASGWSSFGSNTWRERNRKYSFKEEQNKVILIWCLHDCYTFFRPLGFKLTHLLIQQDNFLHIISECILLLFINIINICYHW